MWRARILSNALSTLTIVPPILMAFGARKPKTPARAHWRLLEFALLTAGLVVAAYYAFGAEAGVATLLCTPLPFLLWAAVRFDIGMLSHVTELAGEALFDAFAPALVKRAIVAVPGKAGAFRFDHELLREVLYNELSVHERAHMHLRAGQGLMSRRDSGCAVSDAALAHHFLAAQPYGDIEVALAYAQTAANEAQHPTLQRALDMLLRATPKHSAGLAAC